MEFEMNATPSVEENIQPTEPTEVVETEETPSEVQETEVEQKPFSFELQYNKDKVVIDSEDKLRELAQKGMNYEKVHSRLQQYETDPLRQWAYEYMKENNFNDPNDFLNAIQRQKEEQAIQQKMQQYIDSGLSQDVALRLAEMERKNLDLEQKLTQFDTKTKQTQDYNDFLNWHESMQQKGIFKEALDATKIPKEVWEQVNNGTPLKTAYMEYQLMNLKTNTEQEVIKNMQKNQQTSPGSVTDNSATEDKPWTAEYIEQMAEKHGMPWVNANYEKIQKSGYYK